MVIDLSGLEAIFAKLLEGSTFGPTEQLQARSEFGTLTVGVADILDPSSIEVRFDCVWPPTEPSVIEHLVATVTGPNGVIHKGPLGEEHGITVPMTPESYPYSVGFSMESEE